MPEKYADILQRSWEDIPQPKLLPEGSWLLRARNISYFPANEEKNQPERVAVFFEAREPMEDVSQQELDALGEGYSYAINDVVKQFTIFRPKDWNDVRKFLELLGVEVKGSQADTFKDAKGREIIGFVTQRTYATKSGEQKTDNDVSSFMAA